jgi:hypothetical protein
MKTLKTVLRQKNETPVILSYLHLRRIIGVLGILLPIVVVLGALPSGNVKGILPSISDYYYSNMREVFVGTLCAIAVFLLAYKGYDIRDAISSKICGLAALGIAFFPTTLSYGMAPCLSFINNGGLASTIHFSCAGILFATFSYMSLVLFRKSSGKARMTKEKTKRNMVYKTCGLTILGCLTLIGVYEIFLKNAIDPEKIRPIFWAEVVMLFSFGTSWLVKSEAIIKDK